MPVDEHGGCVYLVGSNCNCQVMVSDDGYPTHVFEQLDVCQTRQFSANENFSHKVRDMLHKKLRRMVIV